MSGDHPRPEMLSYAKNGDPGSAGVSVEASDQETMNACPASRAIPNLGQSQLFELRMGQFDCPCTEVEPSTSIACMAMILGRINLIKMLILIPYPFGSSENIAIVKLFSPSLSEFFRFF